MPPAAPCFAFACVALAVAVPAQTDPGVPPTAPARRPFCRFVEVEGGGRLEVLVARYRRAEATVTLHASLHIAEPAHYKELQRRFTVFDALLYELVAERDLRPSPELELDDSDPLSMLMAAMGNGLGLVDQCEVLDYRPANFVHADMTPDEFEDAMAAAGKSALGELLANQPEVDRAAEARLRKIDLVAAFRSGKGRHELRVLMARIMASEDQAAREPRVLIEGRNERCLAVLQRELAAGRKNLGVYYGAAHMEHLERRLCQDLGFGRIDEQWLVAWDCSADRAPAQEKGLQQKRYRARRDLEVLHAAVLAWRAADHDGGLPSWDALRRAQPGGKLPGRADGLDPWGREYVLRASGGGFELRSCGSDGKPDTEDDVTWTPGG